MSLLDNDNRKQRLISLRDACVSYGNRHNSIAESAYEKSETLMKAVNDILKMQNKTIGDILPALPYEHIVFQGGFSIQPKELGTDKSWGLHLIAVLLSTQASEKYVGGVFRELALASLVRDMGGGVRFSEAMIAEEVGLVYRNMSWGRWLKIRGIGLGVGIAVFALIEIGIYNLEKSDLIRGIQELAPVRLMSAYRFNIMEQIERIISVYALSAEDKLVSLQNKDIDKCDVRKEILAPLLGRLKKVEEGLFQQTIAELQKGDKDSNSYLADDGEWEKKTLEVESGVLKKVIVRHGSVVDSIVCEMSDGKKREKNGGNGGQFENIIEMVEGEYITEVKWTKGVWQSLGKEVVYSLEIKTNKGKSYGPYGNGSGMSTKVSCEFKTPDNYKIIQFVDIKAKMKYEDNKVVLDCPEYIADLKMVVGKP